MSPIESRPESTTARPRPPGRPPAEPPRVGEVDADWSWLYRIGSLAAALLVVVTVLHSSV